MNNSSKNSDDEDVQITKVVSGKPKKAMTWVASSFDSFGPDLHSAQVTLLSNKVSFSSKNRGSLGCHISARKTLSSNTEAVSRKRPREESLRNCEEQLLFPSSSKHAQKSELWSDKYKPKSKADLAVHKKKVEEISEWFIKALSHNAKGCASASILLLTGPPGAGKTACVKVLCNDLGYSLQEWCGTSDQWISTENRSEHSQVDTYQSQSQSSVFHNFLLRASKYKALDLTLHAETPATSKSESLFCSNSKPTNDKKAVIVVEEMPNIFYRDPGQFHDIMRKYKRCGKSPLVFIVSDSNSNSSGIQKLFPKDLMNQLHIANISMNPVAPTMLVKLLTKIANAECGKCPMPSVSVIETIAVSSGGDIRSALNTLQFACGKDTLDLRAKFTLPAKPQLKKQGSSGARLKYGSLRRTGSGDGDDRDSLGLALGLKDKAIFLFQSVGKVLHFKRGNPIDHPYIQSLPNHLNQFDRDPLLVDPEEVAFKSQLSGDSLTAFLHENYVEFLSTVEDLERAAEYFSDADSLSALWTAREDLQSYSVSVAMRGYIHSNSDITRHDSTRRNLGWLPLHKSRWFTASRKAIENVTSARQLFKGYHWEPEVLCTEILPYLNLSNPTLHDPGQISFVQEMTTFSRVTQLSRSHLERLNEKDVVDDEEEEVHNKACASKNPTETDDDTNLLSSQSKIQPLQKDDNSSDEEGLIEEFDEEEDDFGDFMFS